MLDEEEALRIIDGLFAEWTKELVNTLGPIEEKARGVARLEASEIYDAQAFINGQLSVTALSLGSIMGRLKKITQAFLTHVGTTLRSFLTRLFGFLMKIGGSVKQWTVTFKAAAPPSAEFSVTFEP